MNLFKTLAMIGMVGLMGDRNWDLGDREPPGEEAHWSLPQTSPPLT
jgi:hypothetical protein